jgi:hypothetical protein
MSWEEPWQGELLPLLDDLQWSTLLDRYPSEPPISATAFRRCLDVLRSNGAKSVVIETRYVDADYRGEYSTFFPAHSKVFLIVLIGCIFFERA